MINLSGVYHALRTCLPWICLLFLPFLEDMFTKLSLVVDHYLRTCLHGLVSCLPFPEDMLTKVCLVVYHGHRTFSASVC